MCTREQRGFDYRELTPEQWTELRTCIEGQARAARAQALRELLDRGLCLLRAAASGVREVAGPVAGAIAATARRWWAAHAARRERRAAVRELAALDDRALKDIGLSRSEIEYVVYGQAIGRWREGAVVPARGGEPEVGAGAQRAKISGGTPALRTRAPASAVRRQHAPDVIPSGNPFAAENASGRYAKAAGPCR
jgi:uncharacterized protein YjiS (DUF1127 family)